MKSIFCVLIVLVCSLNIYSQAQSEEGHFLFEPEKFSPPTKDMIASYEGFPATPFMAKNLKGEELYIGDFKGSDLVMLFWRIDDENCLEHLDEIKRLVSTYESSLEVVSFIDADRVKAMKFARDNDINFDIIPNSSMFGEAVYANELGYPRIFMVNENGVIKKVVPQEAFDTAKDSYEMLKELVTKEF